MQDWDNRRTRTSLINVCWLEEHVDDDVELAVVAIRDLDLNWEIFAEICGSLLCDIDMDAVRAVAHTSFSVVLVSYGYETWWRDGAEPPGRTGKGIWWSWHNRNFDPPAALLDRENKLGDLALGQYQPFQCRRLTY